MRPISVLVPAAFACLSGAAASASLSQAVIASPGGFVQAGAFSQTCACIVYPGIDVGSAFGPWQDFHEQAFSGASSAQEVASYSGGGIANGATGTVGMGVLGMTANNTSPDASPFAAGVANGGWKETFTVNHPALTGQPGFMVFQIRARGSMHVEGLTGSSHLTTTGFKDNVELTDNPLFDRGNADPVGGGFQRARWGVASFGLPDNRVVDGTVTMAVPITFGQSFTLGVYAMAVCSQRSSGGAGGSSTATLDFSGQGVIWNGIVSVQASGSPVSGYTIISGTGINWGPPQGCYANCDGSTATPVLTANDFQCFLNRFAATDPAANCDGSTATPILTANDFVCFISKYAQGCP
jgi:hypothetical protein